MHAPQVAFVGALLATALWLPEGDVAARGHELFDRRCAGCHAVDSTKVGPPLRGVFRRPAATVPKFPYSEALRKMRTVWDEPALDRWLTDPEALVPGSYMDFRVSRPDERAAIIAYLRQVAEKRGQR